MSDFEVVKTRFFAGIWEGIVSRAVPRDADPNIQVSHLGVALQDVSIAKNDAATNEWYLQFNIPANLLSDGVQVFLITDLDTSEKLTAFTIVTGEPLEDDIRAETELLRAELDLLKRAFRRHCLES